MRCATSLFTIPKSRTERDKDEIILTADTKALQSFVRAHFNDEKFFTDATAFRRRTGASAGN
jgi:hypothetical protein